MLWLLLIQIYLSEGAISTSVFSRFLLVVHFKQMIDEFLSTQSEAASIKAN
jgi:hypothetical protein